MRTSASYNLNWLKFLFAGIVVFVILFWAYKTIVIGFRVESTISLSIFSLIYLFYLFLSRKYKTLEFDNENMYFKTFSKEEVVPLKYVYKIKKIGYQVNDKHMWKVSFYNFEGNEKTIRILPKWEGFSTFIYLVKEANEHLILIEKTKFFDFDQ